MADQGADRRKQFPHFLQASGESMRALDRSAASLAEWETQKQQIRRKLLAAWGGFPTEKVALEPQILGELKRDGYRVEKVVFQTLPGVRMTANAYVPNGSGPFPAVLAVHGHWRGAKQDPVVQSRCIGLAKLGFFVLCVDAFGAGERGLSKNLGEYHGEMVGATLFPIGMPLSGIQVYENMRAADYLQSRPEVDGSKLGITGASGGGNQSMYAGAFDERFKVVVPVCSVGSYQSYLQAACCVCEVVPGGLTISEEAGILALTAPRALMVVNATMDSFVFSVGESSRTLNSVKPVYQLYGKPDALRHAVFESRHDYNQPMREAMYGWMTLHLKGQGDGAPIPEPKFQTENPEELRCYPGDSRPDNYTTIPRFAAAAGEKMLMRHTLPDHLEHWEANSVGMRHALERDVFGRFPKRTDLKVQLDAEAKSSDGATLPLIRFQPEPGIDLDATVRLAPEAKRLAVILDLEAGSEPKPEDREWVEAGWGVVHVGLRATGPLAHPQDKIGRATDHNTAEWAMWVGRPLLAQWTWDLLRLLDALEQTGVMQGRRVSVIGHGSAGLVGLCGAVFDRRIASVACIRTLASYLTDVPYVGQRMGILAPHIVRKVGDVAHLAALVAPRPVAFIASVLGSGDSVPATELGERFAYSQRIWDLQKASKNLLVAEKAESSEWRKHLG